MSRCTLPRRARWAAPRKMPQQMGIRARAVLAVVAIPDEVAEGAGDEERDEALALLFREAPLQQHWKEAGMGDLCNEANDPSVLVLMASHLAGQVDGEGGRALILLLLAFHWFIVTTDRDPVGHLVVQLYGEKHVHDGVGQ